jgi:hypothetical protein
MEPHHTNMTGRAYGVPSVPREQFSDLKLRSLKPPSNGQLDYWDATLPGFGLRVSQGGAKTFILKHRNRRITMPFSHPVARPGPPGGKEAARGIHPGAL